MTRRSPGTGTIDRLPSGHYRWRLTLADGTRLQGVCATEEMARLELDGAREVYSGGAVPVSSLSLGSYGSRWLDLRRTANADTERSLWRHHVLETSLAVLPVKEVRLRQIKRWVESLRRHKALVQGPGGVRIPGADPISPQTQKLCLALVRRVLSAARLDGLIEVNPAEGAGQLIDWPEADLDTETWTYLCMEEIVQLLSCQEIPQAAQLHYGWAIGSGARQRESWGLRWRDLDLRGLRGEIRRSGGRSTTKTGKIRRFPLLPLAADALLQWLDLAPDTRPDALVWPARLMPPTPGGTRWRSPGEMRPRGDDFGWADRSRGKQGIQPGHKTAAGIARRVTYHDLRDTCVVALLRGYSVMGISRPWTPAEACAFIGHGSVAMTERYGHLSDGGLAINAARESSSGVPPSQISPEESQAPARQEAAGRSADPMALAPGHAEVTTSAAPALSLVGDRGATRTRDLLFRKQFEDRAAPGVTGDRDLCVTSEQLAQQFVIDVARGRRGDPEGLAMAVLREVAGLAVQVLEGGDHQIARALDLAEQILDRSERSKSQCS